jgi:hypothetical protein
MRSSSFYLALGFLFFSCGSPGLKARDSSSDQGSGSNDWFRTKIVELFQLQIDGKINAASINYALKSKKDYKGMSKEAVSKLLRSIGDQLAEGDWRLVDGNDVWVLYIYAKEVISTSGETYKRSAGAVAFVFDSDGNVRNTGYNEETYRRTRSSSDEETQKKRP